MVASSEHPLLERLGCIELEADFESFRISRISPNVEDVLGYAPEACCEPDFFLKQLIHEEDVESVAAGLMELFGTSRVELAFRVVCRNGRAIDVLAIFVLINEDVHPAFSGVLFQHSGELRSQQLRDDRLQLALDSADMGVWDWNLSEWTIFWSDQVYRLHGTTHEEVGDLFENPDSMLEKVHPDDLPVVQAIVLDALRTGSDYDIEYRFEVGGDTYRWINVKGRMYPNEAGQPNRIAGTAQDITARKTAEIAARRELIERRRTETELKQLTETLEERVQERTAELERANEHLKHLVAERSRAQRDLGQMNRRLMRSNEELRDFAHVASHDLQEPLRKITTFADLLRAEHGSSLGEEGVLFLERMQQSAHRMTQLIDDLLQFSRLTTSGQDFAMVDLNAIVEEVLTDLEVRIEEVGAAIDVDELPTIEAEPTQLRRLFQNLIANAIKFRRDDVAPVVEIHATVSRGEAGSEARCRVTITDNGIGLDEQYSKRIFAPFQRLHRDYEGTGIGLAICRRIVEYHQGSIHVESAPGEGAAFMVDLPLSQGENPHLFAEHRSALLDMPESGR